MKEKNKSFKWRLKTIGSIYHHDSQWKEIFIENNFEWNNWWDKYCDGMRNLTGSFIDDELNKKGLKNSISIFDKKGENKFIEWLYSGDRNILKIFYDWFSKEMEREAIREINSSNIQKKENYEEKKAEGYIYVIKSKEYYKIGRALNPKQRIQKYITENPNKIKVILCKKVKDYIKTEKELHLKFKDKNHNREWFKLNKEDIILIKNYLKKKIYEQNFS